MAGAIELTGVDFDQIKQNLVDWLKTQPGLTDYDFTGSNLQVILNLLAYQSQLNAYSTNMIANESFLTSSSIRDNVVANARSLGYVPISARSAVITINFEVQLSREVYTQGFPQFLEIAPGSVFTAGTDDGSFMFNTIETHNAAVDNDGLCKFHNIRAYEGVFLPMVFTVDKKNYLQKFILENPNIDTTTIRVEVQEDPNITINTFYRQANNLVTLTHQSPVYWIEEENEGYYELTFGDGMFGKALNDGAKIFVSYVATNGVLGNGIRDAANYAFGGQVIDSFGNSVTEPMTILSVSTSEGGADPESVSSVKFRAPKHYGAQNRCVTSTDYEALVRRVYPSVEGIYAYGGETLPVPEYGRVYIAIKPILGDKLSNITKNFIKKSLQPYRVGSLDIVIQDPNVLYVEVDTVVYYDEAKTIKDSSLIQSDVSMVLNEYSRSLNVAKFGGAARYSNIVGIIDDAEDAITRNNTQLIMRKDGKALMNTLASYEICFEQMIDLDITRSVCYSSTFRLEVDNIEDKKIYRFEDDPEEGNLVHYEKVDYVDLTKKQKEYVRAKIATDSEAKLPAFVYVNKQTDDIQISRPLGKIRTFYFNNLNQKIIADKDFGTIDYDRGEIKIGYQKPIKIVETPDTDGIIQVRCIPREQDVIADHSVYLSLDIARSNINATVDTKIAEI